MTGRRSIWETDLYLKEFIMADRVGQQLGNYRLVRKIGQGGFAEVYLGQHIYLDTSAAIKVLHTQLDSDDVEHFRSEARTIARLLHPNIVRVLEFNVEEMTPYLVVDYAPNGTLRKRHPRGVPLAPSTVVGYTRQVAAALFYAHEQKVIHRDVKPENMLVGRRNEILLTDFGIALVAQSSRYSGIHGIQEMAGTIAYMAPEQIHSQACPNSDQYSLGIVVYEWLSGARPFQGSFAEIAVKQTMTPPPPLQEKVPGIPPVVEEVVMQALAKDPQQRFESVQAFALALEKAFSKELASSSVLSGSPVAEIEPSSKNTIVLSSVETPEESFATVQSLPPELIPSPPTTSVLNATSSLQQPETTSLPSHPQQRYISRRSVVIGLASLAAVGIAGGGIALLAHMQKPSTPLQMEAIPLFTYTGHSNWVWSVAWSSLSERIASASSDSTAQVWDAANGDHPVYLNHADTVYAVAWSPDSKSIASASYDKRVQVWDPTFGDHFYTYTGHTSWVWSVAWSPNGKSIASAGGDKTVQVWDAADGRHTYTYTGHTGYVYTVAWSPGGQRIASAGTDGTVQVWDPANGKSLYTFRLPDTTMWSVAWSPDGQRIASGSNNNTVQVWNATDGSYQFILGGHTDFVYGVAWSPDGKHIASASGDKTVRVWDAANGHHICTYSGHTGSVRSVSWAPDSKRLASASWDKTVQVWRMQ
jgi:WD40 repeat protein/tRNA A-37 threonylcarbamoyl transferase component Bud32